MAAMNLETTLVTASSTAGTVDPTRPAWFSGTACTATAVADLALLYGTNPIPAGDYITAATLSIGGEVVRTYPEDYAGSAPVCGTSLPPTGLTSLPNMAVMWDSTHFPDNTPIPVEVEVHDAKGKQYKAHITAPTCNKADALCNNTIDFEVSSNLPGNDAGDLTNYKTIQSSSMQKNDILASLPGLTAFYVSTHGSPSAFGDCDVTRSSSPYFILYALNDPTASQGGVDITTEIGKKSLSQPPYGFVFTDACETGSSNALATAFGITDGSQDRGFLGWIDSYYIDSNHVDWTTRFMQNLSNQQTLRAALIAADLDGPANGTWNPNLAPPPYNVPAVPMIHGDGKMTTHGVYGSPLGYGGAANQYDWYRPM